MQLHLSRTEQKKGLFGKKIEHKVTTRIEADEDEIGAIKALGLMDAQMVEPYSYDGIDWDMNVSGALYTKGRSLCTADMSHIIELEERIKSAAKDLSVQVKLYLQDGGGDKEEVIDL